MFPYRLKQLRKNIGLTQKELAKKLNLTQSTIAYYESGRKMPTLENAKLIAKIFDTSLDYLLGISDNKIPTPDDKKNETISTIDKFFRDISNLSPESREDLENYIKLLKLRDLQKRNSDCKDGLINLN